MSYISKEAESRYDLLTEIQAVTPTAGLRAWAKDTGLSYIANGSAWVAQPTASTSIIATGTPSSTTYLRGDGTWSTPAGGGGGSLPTQTGNARKVLVTDGTNASWTFGKGNFTTFLVAANNSSASDKAIAEYVCDGTADDVEINLALQAAKTAGGGIIKLAGGTFNIAAPLYIEGQNTADDSPMIAIVGAGIEATNLIGASGVNVIVLRYMPKPKVNDLCITVNGAADAISSLALTTGSTDRRGFWQGEFTNIFVKGTGSHSGWVLNLENPFRSYFKNIQTGTGIKNGIWLKSTYANFNPGNVVFEVCQMGLSVANGTAYRLTSADNGGFMNIATFIECDCIDTAASTTSVGWLFEGSTTSYFTTRDMLVLRSNPEGFNTGVKLSHAANIEFIANFANPKNGGKMFDVSADSVNNILSVLYLYVDGSSTVNAFTDLNTDANKPNYFIRSFARVETGGTLNITPSVTSRIFELARDSDGSGVYPSIWTPDYRKGTTTFVDSVVAPTATPGTSTGQVATTKFVMDNDLLDAHLAGAETFTGAKTFTPAVTLNGGATLNATSLATDTTTGLKIGTSTTQKLGFFNATPIVQGSATTDPATVMSQLGLRASGTGYSITTTGQVAIGSGGMRSTITNRTANVSLSNTSSWHQTVNATSGAITVTLPAANSTSGQMIWVKKIDSSANAVTIARAGTDLIDGGTSYVLSTQNKYVEFINDGTSNWWVKDNN